MQSNARDKIANIIGNLYILVAEKEEHIALLLQQRTAEHTPVPKAASDESPPKIISDESGLPVGKQWAGLTKVEA